MFLKKIFLISCFLMSLTGLSQDMNEGFTYLESGKYKEAELFFKDILKTYPKNKTARLCYGRAVGLNGNSTKALNLFINLLNDFPNDFEVKLNYAESLLWDKKFDVAENYYEKLIKENDKSFSALLGYANTLSNLKKYNKALVYVDKALEVSPNNPNALVSKKYMRLGLANEYLNKQEYSKAEAILKENFRDFKDDKETLLNLANLYLISNQYSKAEETYIKLGSNNENKNISLNGLALVQHLKSKNKLALNTSKTSVNSLPSKASKDITNQTIERYIQALIWNKKFKEADKEINNLFKSNNEPENWMLSLRATLNIYKSNFDKSIEDYNLILKKDSASFDGNLGKANALKALGYYNKAYLGAENTLSFYDNQKDATQFINKLDESFTPFVEAKTSYSFDNGNNDAYMYQLNGEYSFSTKFKVLASYNHRFTKNPVTNLEATSNNVLVGFSYQLFNNVVFKSNLGVTSSNANSNDFTQLLADVAFEIKPFKLQNLEIGYKREIQNFNAELIDREIVQNNFILNYNLSTNFNLGWFTQYYYTSQNDSNTRNLLFTSLYYNILEKPSLKAGVNYQYITFKNQVPTIYFSPSKFNAYEIFINLIKDENIAKNKTWFYDLTAATGLQFIEDDAKQSTYRIQGKLGYKFSERSLLNIYALQSNIASATAAGFTFTEIGLRFKWLFLKKPVFRKN